MKMKKEEASLSPSSPVLSTTSHFQLTQLGWKIITATLEDQAYLINTVFFQKCACMTQYTPQPHHNLQLSSLLFTETFSQVQYLLSPSSVLLSKLQFLPRYPPNFNKNFIALQSTLILPHPLIKNDPIPSQAQESTQD